MRPHKVLLPLGAVQLGLGGLLVLAGLATGAGLLGGLGLGASLLVMGGLCLLVGLRARDRPADWTSPAAVPPVAPLPPADEPALDAIPEPVQACPHCGSLGLRPPRMGEGGIPGVAEVSDKRVCARCGYQGLAVEFARREDYEAFLRDVDAAGRAPGA